MSEETKLYCFTENNQWEGEQWDFFVRLTEKQHEELSLLLEELDNDETYSISDRTYTDEEVKVLIENAREGYMDSHNYAGVLTEKLPKAKEFDEDDPFYKGRFSEHYCDIDEPLL